MVDLITHNSELNAYFANNGKRSSKRGISGDITEFALKRFDADAIQLKPKNCILLIGINDTWDLEYDPWLNRKGMKVENVIKRAYSNIKEIISKAKENNVNIIICFILPTNKERNIYVEEVNRKLKKLYVEERLIYVDYYSEFVEKGDNRVKDGLTIE